MKKLVSVIIPAYNHEKYIKDAINSVLNQTYKNIELIVEDDCSKDNTVKEIKKIKDKRLKTIFSKENKGPVRTMNHLLSMCKGDYIAILGSDDVWYPEKLEKQLEYFENKKVGAVFSMMDVIDENGNRSEEADFFETVVFKKENKTKGKHIRTFYEQGNYLCHPSSIVSRKAFEEIGYYNSAYKQLHDFDYWTRLLNKYEIYIVPEKLLGYRRSSTGNNLSSINKNEIAIINESYEIMKKLFEEIEDDTFIDGFKDLFVNKKSKTKEELLCEKLIILSNLKVQSVNNKFLGLSLLSNQDNVNEILDLLEEKYNYSLKDFYKDNAEVMDFYSMSLLVNHKKDFEDLKREREILQEQVKNLSTELNGVYNSKSWKITKPLRLVMERIKK